MMTQLNLRNDYLTKQLISYIGNKRRLLPFIEEALSDSAKSLFPGATFVDLFAGSGSVARLAKSLNYKVIANDWEDYSYQINRCYIQGNLEDLTESFMAQGGLESVLQHLNSLQSPKKGKEYIAKYYAPQSWDPEEASIGKERMFYTRENALILDALRDQIEDWYPLNRGESLEKSILLGPLLYLASKHTNTSGVFKAYHKGFGGYGKDALSRILKPIKIPFPILLPRTWDHQIEKLDANLLVKEMDKAEIVYMDPPYNQHQYGSNYHILNTIALWDKIPQPLDFKSSGELKRKAAIREDWVKTRSPYCRKNQAVDAFSELISHTKAKKIMISYSSDGIIPMEEMKKICQGKGRLSLLSNPYTVYRGGRQSSKRKNSNLEFLWIIDTEMTNSTQSVKALDRQWLKQEISMMCKGIFRLRDLYNIDDPLWKFKASQGFIEIELASAYTIKGVEYPEKVSIEDLENLKKELQNRLCHNRQEELDYLIELLNKDDKKNWILEVCLRLIKKIAHPKTKQDFWKYFDQLNSITNGMDGLEAFRIKLDKIRLLAEMRMGNRNRK